MSEDTTRFKKITDYTMEELNDAVDRAVQVVPNFWTVMKGVDAYMERRRRKETSSTKTTLTSPFETPTPPRGKGP